ncbi:PR-1-like protein [Karstenula rhodostoma CBS 690.94]|uniref:PR-1-like protein n=1 Tax=Karstenula rhodostoma CBS 690.94 TaxID=1392251 RepID=A0A9P4PTY8_9PLEO|nr:PR-1-like protein [Karstenula rhodostoma CBS 690.94]
MRYSVIAASLLASTASAWRLPDFDYSNNGYQGWPRPSLSSSVAVSAAPTKTAAASVSHVATTVVATVAPTSAIAGAVSTKAATKTAAAASTSTGSSGSLTSDEQAALDAHNDARAEVGTADLSWDASLAADALAYAKTLASSGTFEHSGVSGQGENLFMQYSSDTPFANAVKGFLAEKSSYNGEAITSTNYLTFGHYTQSVWKDTTQVGMGAAQGSDGATYVVARYKGPGNYEGETAY